MAFTLGMVETTAGVILGSEAAVTDVHLKRGSIFVDSHDARVVMKFNAAGFSRGVSSVKR